MTSCYQSSYRNIQMRMSLCPVLVFIIGIFYIFMNVIMLWSNNLQQPCDCSNLKSRCTSQELKPVDLTSARSMENATTLSLNHVTNTENHVTVRNQSDNEWGPHRLAVVVPLRGRWEELIQFVPHIHQFLNRQKVSHEIWVIIQIDKHRFNRAMLLNIGFARSRTTCDYMVMHDVDLLPLNNDLKYSYPHDGPVHISSPQLHPLYHYEKFVGGILMINNKHFEELNGLSNIFWGWGREDDEFYLRMKEAGLKIHRPQGIKTGYNTFLHIHDKKERPRDMKSYGNQYKMSRKRDKDTGLNTIQYQLVNIVNMTINDAPVKLVNIKLHCDYEKTPFCDHPS